MLVAGKGSRVGIPHERAGLRPNIKQHNLAGLFRALPSASSICRRGSAWATWTNPHSSPGRPRFRPWASRNHRPS